MIKADLLDMSNYAQETMQSKLLVWTKEMDTRVFNAEEGVMDTRRKCRKKV